MIDFLVYAMVYAGSALMVYNIPGLISFTRFIKGLKTDLMIAGILFGGSIFDLITYRPLKGITLRILKTTRMKGGIAS